MPRAIPIEEHTTEAQKISIPRSAHPMQEGPVLDIHQEFHRPEHMTENQRKP